MKKIFLIATTLFMLSCTNEKKDEKQADVKTTEVKLPVKMDYNGAPAVGKTENIATVMNFNSDFIAGKFDNIGSYLSDSVRCVFEDGTDVNSVRDSIVTIIKNWRGSMNSANQKYISAVALDNKDMGHEWVFQWIDETHNYKNGKIEHFIYHEDYRLENGKIRELFQYAQGIPEKK